MNLDKLIQGLEVKDRIGDVEGTEITDLEYDSRKVSSSTLFFCVPGHVTDGHDFARDAVERGAAALICERKLDLDVAQVVVEDARALMAQIAVRFFGEPTGSLKLVGITGTNGKTTTAHILREILEAHGVNCGLLGTVEQIVGGVSEPVERTTPEAIDLQRTFSRMIERGDRACVMEVSSHALELNRSDLIEFDACVFTNLSQDHLDFHGTMEAYFSAKRKLFFPTVGLIPAVSAINADDPYGRKLIDDLKSSDRTVLSYGIETKDVDFRAVDIDPESLGRSFTVKTFDGGSKQVQTHLLGAFNIYNVLAALAAGEGLGVNLDESVEALGRIKPVPGRFEPVEAGQEFKVLIDYAHTPDSLENVLQGVRDVTEGRVIAVFGCGGDRDQGKRPLMGEAACRLADLIFVTSDNPRNEQPEKIIEEILVGAHRVKDPGDESLVVDADRRRAIAAALEQAQPGDTVVIAGKGHETGQEFERGRKIEFDDKKVAVEELQRLSI